MSTINKNKKTLEITRIRIIIILEQDKNKVMMMDVTGKGVTGNRTD